MDYINDPTIQSTDKVKCECGSEILLKNMGQHLKTKKHLQAKAGLTKPSVEPLKTTTTPLSEQNGSEDEYDDDEYDDGDDLDDIAKALVAIHSAVESLRDEVRSRFDALENSTEQGFDEILIALDVPEELETVQEEPEEKKVEKKEEVKKETVKELVKKVEKKLKK